MNSTEFISFLDDAIHQEMLLGGARNEFRLIGLRNIKSDFNYIASRESKLDAIDIVKRLYKEREENAQIYKDAKKQDLWLQENAEKCILQAFLPKEPDSNEVWAFLTSLDIPKQKSSFKKFQDACLEKFGQKIDSGIILNFINN